MTVHTILLICWIFYCLIEGKRDGHFYYVWSNSSNPKRANIHWLFFIDRFIVISLIDFVHSFYYSVINTLIFTIGLSLIFSFFHNGMYYITRNNLDETVYQEGWWASSTTSQAILEFNVQIRTIMAIIGLLAIISTYMI